MQGVVSRTCALPYPALCCSSITAMHTLLSSPPLPGRLGEALGENDRVSPSMCDDPFIRLMERGCRRGQLPRSAVR